MSDNLAIRNRMSMEMYRAQDALRRACGTIEENELMAIDCGYIAAQCEYAITALQRIVDLTEEHRVGYASLGELPKEGGPSS